MASTPQLNPRFGEKRNVPRRSGARVPAPTFPAVPIEGDLFYETDTDKLWTWDGTDWNQVTHQAALDARIAAASVTLPSSPTEGQLFYKTDTDILYVWDGAAWRKVSEDSGWLSPSFTNGWVIYSDGNYGISSVYRKLNGVVYLRGLMDGDAPASADAAFVLPAGYRPAGVNRLFSNISSAGILRVDVLGDGTVNIQSRANWCSLNGISFIAEA